MTLVGDRCSTGSRGWSPLSTARCWCPLAGLAFVRLVHRLTGRGSGPQREPLAGHRGVFAAGCRSSRASAGGRIALIEQSRRLPHRKLLPDRIPGEQTLRQRNTQSNCGGVGLPPAQPPTFPGRGAFVVELPHDVVATEAASPRNAVLIAMVTSRRFKPPGTWRTRSASTATMYERLATAFEKVTGSLCCRFSPGTSTTN